MTKKKIMLAKQDIPPSEEVQADTSVEAAAEANALIQTKQNFPIVGIGASAGGLAAFEAFFSAMPIDADMDMAFVLVQHLAPDHKSILSDLIRRYTKMQVFEVEDGMTVKPDCAYIIPPNRDMAFLNGNLQLMEPAAPRGQRLPIDFFFRSLAQDRHERSICIVLSGSGSDGTLGARAIKDEGGMVMVQNPESTEYDAMPRSVIAAGLADYILPPAEMPAQLIAYTAHAFEKTYHPVSPPSPKSENDLKKISILVRSQTGHDFSQYKHNTITRRVERRMAVQQIGRIDEYVRYLQQNPAEVKALFRDLLIGVTNFFRDPEAFEALEKQAIPHLFAGKPADALIRTWVPGCSTGEEAYSIAILLTEQMEELKQHFQLQVFASDIDSRAIDVGRSGLYPASIVADILPERLKRFFTQEPDSSVYRIRKGIRDLMIFSEQDMIKDPPFSKLDLISCRNLLIYMSGELQKKIIPLFHYALNPGGMLFLGTSETIGEFSDLFALIDRKSKLYQRKEDMPDTKRAARGKFLMPAKEDGIALRAAGKVPVQSKLRLRELTQQAMLQHYAPAGALVNESGDILYVHGRTGRYLEPAPGEAVMNILKMAREGLRQDLITALHETMARKEPVRHADLLIKTNGGFSTVTLTVWPAATAGNVSTEPGLFLVVFEESPTSEQERPQNAIVADAGESATNVDTRIAALKHLLQTKEEHLHATNEELETSNEELKSSNEEMQSVNEELQSTNEELETSKEELQSVNEELATVNTELQTKVADLTRVNNDMNNLLASTGIGTIFVDHQLRIQRFTPAVTSVINLIQTDVGRPVGQIVSNLKGYDRLIEDVQKVLDSLVPKDIEVQTIANIWYQLHIRPYRTTENVIEGAVITFTDVTEIKKTREALWEANALKRLAIVVRDTYDAITMQDLDGRILAWNPAAEKLYGWSETEALAMNIRNRIPPDQNTEELAIVKQLGLAKVLKPYATKRLTKDGKTVNVWLTATALINEDGKIYAIATTERASNN